MHHISIVLTIAVLSVSMGIQAQNPLLIPDTLSGQTIQLVLQDGQQTWFTGLPTQTRGANGSILGPTLMLRQHQALTLQVQNQLTDTTTIHWHGMHVAPQNDGGPHTPIMPGAIWSPSFQVLDHAATMWYHPHLHYKTYDHVQQGIAGFIYVRDSLEAALSLPRTYGIDDIPLAIQTKAIDANNQIRTDHTALDTFLLVNATYKPYVDLPAQQVRLRLLNGSPERVYLFGFSDNRTFSMIASDNGLLSAPVTLNRLLMAPGERAEILVNLSGDLGNTLFLMNYGASIPSGRYGAAQPGMGPNQTIPDYNSNPLNGANFNVLEIRVGPPSSNPVFQVPSTLISHQPWAENQANATRTLTFTMMGGGGGGGGMSLTGPFVINGAHFDMNTINYSVPFNNIEVWELRNQSPIAHPFHIHNVPFYILDINGQVPPAEFRGKKDVVLVPPGNGVVRFITQFEDFYNDTLPYMYHCHMITHEDDGMMGQYVVNSPCSLLTQQPQDVVVAVGGTAQFSVAVQQGQAATYQWQLNLGLGFQNLQNAGQYSGVQTPVLTVANVSLQNDNQLYRCLIESDICDASSDIARLSVGNSGLPGLFEEPFALFPNPGKAELNLRIPTSWLGSDWELSTMHGQKVASGRQTATEHSINTQTLPQGVYIVRWFGPAGVHAATWMKE
jgi:FtsP/CotA-like multicopper oxidase with cupredoxin domain